MSIGFVVLWRSLVHLWDESLLIIRGNLVWFFASIPLFLIVLAVLLMFVPLPADPEEEGSVISLALPLAGFLLLAFPNPLAMGLHGLAGEIVVGDTPEFGEFWRALRRWWKHGLLMFVIGVVVLGALIFNTAFYMSVTEGVLQAVSILWVYAIFFWISMQAYLAPLLISGEQIGLGTLYKRAAILAVANPILTLVLLLNTFLAMIISMIAIPIYPLITMGYVVLVQERALFQLRLKYMPPEEQEEAAN